MNTKITFKLTHHKCLTNALAQVEWACYKNGRLAMLLEDPESGQRLAVATVNVDEPLDDDEIAVKNYSESEGMLDSLVEANLVEDTGRRIPSGYVQIPVARLLVTPDPDPREEWRVREVENGN